MTIIITLPHFFEGEAQKIASFLEEGIADLVHIRKPGESEADVERLIQQIPQQYHSRLVIHGHHSLAVKYALHGIHLNGHTTSIPVLEGAGHTTSIPVLEGAGHTASAPVLEASASSLSISRSCHSLEELKSWKDRCNYLSLSPIFDSISKKGYMSAFSEEDIRRAHQEGIIDEKVVALGGVTFDKLEKVKEMGFGGAMILGDAWDKL